MSVLPGSAFGHESGAEDDGELGRHADPISSFGPRSEGQLPVPSPATAGGSSDGVGARSSGPCATVDTAIDDFEHARHPASAAVIKVVYAHPVDAPSRLAKYAPMIEAGVQTASGFIASSSENTRSIRLDVGTSQGPQCLDIQHVTLPLPALSYTSSPSTAFSLIRTQLKGLLGVQPGVRNYLIYADGIPMGGLAGEAQVYSDDSYAGSSHARGGLFAVLYGSGGNDFFGSPVAYAAGSTSRIHLEVALHEIGHNLGAVQPSSPNSTDGFHCRDEWDLLCYDDDGRGGIATFTACGSPYSTSYEAWDCGQNDYFNPSPPAGSYLASHWNLYRSVFLCQVSACGSGWAAGPIDRRSPRTRIRRGPKRKSYRRSPRFRFSSDEPGSTFQCKLNRGRYRSCTSPRRLKRLRFGRHVFRVRALDPANNLDSSPAVRRFRVLRRR